MERVIRMLRVLPGRHADDDDEETRTRSTEEIGTRRSRRVNRSVNFQIGRRSRELSVQEAAEMIDELPSDVPRESALRIVLGTLAATGIEVSNLERFIQERASKLGSEVELAHDRQKEFRAKTEETVRALEEEIRNAREACDAVLSEEERRISRASAALKEVRRVRAFFDLPETDGEENIGPIDQGTQPLRVVGARAMRRSGPSLGTDGTSHGAAEGSPEYDTPPRHGR